MLNERNRPPARCDEVPPAGRGASVLHRWTHGDILPCRAVKEEDGTVYVESWIQPDNGSAALEDEPGRWRPLGPNPAARTHGQHSLWVLRLKSGRLLSCVADGPSSAYGIAAVKAATESGHDQVALIWEPRVAALMR